MKYFTREHEWLTCEDGIATVGITAHAAQALGELVYIDPQSAGTVLAAGDVAVVVESVKAASEIFAPLDGTIVEVNEHLVDAPHLVSADPEGEGWMLRIRLSNADDLDSLMDRAAYDHLLATS